MVLEELEEIVGAQDQTSYGGGGGGGGAGSGGTGGTGGPGGGGWTNSKIPDTSAGGYGTLGLGAGGGGSTQVLVTVMVVMVDLDLCCRCRGISGNCKSNRWSITLELKRVYIYCIRSIMLMLD